MSAGAALSRATLVENARKSGALVVFEPSVESDPSLLVDALETAHIVKVASDRLRGNSEVFDAKGPLLLIETLGAEGLRYARNDASGGRQWKSLPAFAVEALRDSAGAGDWCTAGIISAVGTLGPDRLKELPDKELQTAIRLGQAMASWNCRYDGARGGMYVSSKAESEGAISAIRGKAGPAQHSATHKAPRYVVLCNFDEFRIHDFDLQLECPVDVVKLNEASSTPRDASTGAGNNDRKGRQSTMSVPAKGRGDERGGTPG